MNPEFLESIGVKMTQKPWSLHIQWSTTQPKYWVVRRNVLQPHDLLLTLSMNDRYWNISLERRDNLYCVQWRESGIDVESQQLKYRKLVKWPIIQSPTEIKGAIAEIEKVLNINFVKHVNLQGTLSDKIECKQSLAHWLNVSVDDFGVFK